MSTPWKYERDRILNKRLFALLCVFCVLIFVLIGRLFYLQIICGEEYLKMADKNRMSVRLTIPARGYIYDRNGVKLAENKKTFQAILFREETRAYKESVAQFSRLIALDEDELDRIDREVKRKRKFMPVRVKDNLSYRDAAHIQLNAADLRGIQIEEEITRFYPSKEKAAHLIGYVSFLTEKDVTEKDADGKEVINESKAALLDVPGYRIGRIGVEAAFEDMLKGKPGRRKTEINAFGHSVRVLEEEKAEKGQNLTLTIDTRLQETALAALGKESGSVIVMDVRTGEVLTLVSAPSFDANIFTMPIPKKVWNNLIENEKNPLQNKAIGGLYSPGSIFKLVVALAGLESGVITSGRRVFCNGRMAVGSHYFHCWKRGGHGALTLEEALMHSCDVYFYQVAQEIGPDKIIEVARRLGFGVKTGLGLTGEKEGILPTREWKQAKIKEPWRLGDTVNLSIGQGYLTATPVQMVRAVAQIANGGYRVTPHLIASEPSGDGQRETLGFQPAHLKLVRSGMNMVVNTLGGTAYNAHFDINGQKMAGKTASTQVRRISMKERESGVRAQKSLPWKYRDHGMFAAFAPVDHPRFAIIVAVEHGGGGASAAAPIASTVMQEVLRLYPAAEPKKTPAKQEKK